MASLVNQSSTDRGLRQGDPLSPMLFILAMDPLQRILHRATQAGVLNPIGEDPIKLRTSLYADDAALFIRPTAADVSHVRQILEVFGDVSTKRNTFPGRGAIS